jgi:hypothetical protein
MEKASKLLEENEENKTKAKTIELLSPEGKTTVDGLDIFDVALEMDGFL